MARVFALVPATSGLERGPGHTVSAGTFQLPGFDPHLVSFSGFDECAACQPVGGNPDRRRIGHDVLHEPLTDEGPVLSDFHDGAEEVTPCVMAVEGHEVPFVRSGGGEWKLRWCNARA